MGTRCTLGQFLDERLAAIRRQEDAGDLTAREGANMRIRFLEHHIATIGNLAAGTSATPDDSADPRRAGRAASCSGSW
jgi:hypothetical protein